MYCFSHGVTKRRLVRPAGAPNGTQYDMRGKEVKVTVGGKEACSGNSAERVVGISSQLVASDHWVSKEYEWRPGYTTSESRLVYLASKAHLREGPPRTL